MPSTNYQTIRTKCDQRHRIDVRQSYGLPTNYCLSGEKLDLEQTFSDQQNLKKKYRMPEHEYQLKIRETRRLPFGTNHQRPSSISRSNKKMASLNLRSLSSKRQRIVRRILSPLASRKTNEATLKVTTSEKKYLEYSKMIKETLKNKFIQIQKKHIQIQQVNLKCKTLPALYQNIMDNLNLHQINTKQSTFGCLDTDKANKQLETSDGEISFNNS